MRLTDIELHELILPLAEPFIISGGTMTERRSLVVVLHDDAGHSGYGESPPFELPFYSEETLGSARLLLQQVLIPRLLGREVESPEAVDAILRHGVRGNPFARRVNGRLAWPSPPIASPVPVCLNARHGGIMARHPGPRGARPECKLRAGRPRRCHGPRLRATQWDSAVSKNLAPSGVRSRLLTLL